MSRALRRMRAAVLGLVSRRRLDRELDDELAAYLEDLVARNRAAGMDLATARREALVEMDGVQPVRDEVRRGRAGAGLEAVWADVRHAARAIRRMPGLAAVVIASLGTGIGVNTAVFSWLQAVVLQPLPGVRGASAFMLVEPRAESGAYPSASWLEYQDMRERLPAFEDLLAFRMVPLTLGEAGETERIYGLLVSDNYFTALGLAPAAGRFWHPAAARDGALEAVISHPFWRSRFAGASAVVGRTLRVNDRTATIVGVAPEGFRGTVLSLGFDVWVRAADAKALLAGSRELEERSERGYSLLGRLRPGATLAEAQAQADAATAALATDHPDTNAGMRAEVLPFWRAPRGPQRFIAAGLGFLQGLMLLLLLAVCGNTANLLLARGSARRREIGIRLALGAGRWRVARLLLAESLLLALGGAALGIAIAAWGTDALRAAPMIGSVPIHFETHVDAAGLAVAIGLGLACGLGFGVLPTIALVRLDPQGVLRTEPRTGGGRVPMQGALMGVEAGLALLVLIAASMLFKSFRDARVADPGFRQDGVLLAAYDLSGRGLTDGAARELARRILDRAHALPGVEAAAIARSVPLDIHGLPSRTFTLAGRGQRGASPDRALGNLVTPGYFETMGIPFVRGTDFAGLGDATAPAQAIVNEEFARRFLEGGEPLGRELEIRGEKAVIAGVVRNSTSDSFGEPPQPIVYLSYRDRPAADGTIHVRTRAGREALLTTPLRRAVTEIEPTLPLYDVRTLAEHVDRNLIFRKIPARLFSVLGPMLLLLAAIGIYAVVDYAVARRTTEIGLRLALGARGGRVVGGMVLETLRAIAAGMTGAWLLAAVVMIHANRGRIVLSSMVGVPLALLAVAALASWLPARRAARIDPMVALRHE